MRAALLVSLALGLAACGGGGSSPPPPSPPAPPGPVNLSPAFTSGVTASVQENVIGTFYRAIAADPEGGAVNISVTGGADQARFTYNAVTQHLRFTAPPNFEAPTDANGDNVYEVRLAASDGVNVTSLDLRVTVVNVANGLRVRRISSGVLNQPVLLTNFPDDSGRVAVVELGGRVRLMDPTSGAVVSSPMLDVTSEVRRQGEEGLLGLAFSPRFIVDRTFYVHMINASGDTEIRRYRMLASDISRADTTTADVIFTADQPAQFTNHKGGSLEFSRDGLLLLALGDGGGGGDPLGSGQNRDTLLGKILRIDVSGDAYPTDPLRDYQIPASNPFATGGGAPEVWAMGLRNPFRTTVDALTGDVMIGDVGQNAIEEVDRIPFGATGLFNFGWSRREGTQPYNGGTDDPSFLLPVTEYQHGSGPLTGASITGGVVYRGPIEELQALYVFGDFISGNMWTAPFANLNPGATLPSSAYTQRNLSFAPDAGAISQITNFGTDGTGNLYIVSISGQVFRVEPLP